MSAAASLLSPAQEARVVAAIASAERGHRGEIRVHLECRYPGDGPLTRAAALFEALGMAATQDATGVLLYVAIDDRKAAVWAGAGIYGGADPAFWKTVVDAVAESGRSQDPVSGLCTAVRLIGELLQRAAPGVDMAGNELPDEVTTS